MVGLQVRQLAERAGQAIQFPLLRYCPLGHEVQEFVALQVVSTVQVLAPAFRVNPLKHLEQVPFVLRATQSEGTV